MESFEQARSGKGKYEQKQMIESSQVQDVLRKWLSALEQNQDLEVTVNGKNCTIPKEAFQKAKVKLEYEIKNGEYEFELEMKWRDENQALKQ